MKSDFVEKMKRRKPWQKNKVKKPWSSKDLNKVKIEPRRLTNQRFRRDLPEGIDRSTYFQNPSSQR